ncbi:RNAPII transcription regulator C-terminal-domain-containing protein [Lophiotrema nucula]|uniref:MMS19 nucleotide excision repair protein n=1 Tax=Lophiotrema nucula TaxID=690887 RepID=A0A6A5YQ22_9PLEO|nr:RNAPII transcription regulator C-terminal-domain-containing protein [Lophiotrema nucula]
MSNIQQYLLDYDRNKREASATAEKTATRLTAKELKLLSLIEELDEYLNSDDGATRGKTMSYLAEVLSFIPQKVLSIQQRNLLCDFLLSRLDDSEGVGFCARALMALEERGKWDDNQVTKIIEALLNNTHPLQQYRLQSERYSVLRLIDALMAKYRHALQALHDSTPGFMTRFISYFDGEKDPRNLMMVFSILRVPMTEWNIGADAQELFDAVFNYFPITFRPPPDDIYGITAQDLKDRLRECVSSTADFAPYAFPALLDKLDSTSMNTKRDVLTTITSCVAEYGPRTITLYSITLWDTLKFEILNVQEEDLAVEALNGLAAIARTLSQQGANGPLQSYLRPITKECNEHLEDAPTKQSAAAARILRTVAAVSPEVTNIVSANVLPNLFLLFQNADTMSKRRGLLEVLVQLIKANVDLFGSWRALGLAGEAPPKNALVEFRDQALEIMSDGLNSAPVNEVSFRLACLDGLLQLCKTRELLSDQAIGDIIQLFHSIVIHEDSYGKDEVKEAAINGLVDIAHQKPQVVVDKAFPAFLAELPDKDDETSKGYITVLEAFAKLASEDKIFDTVVLRLKNKFSSAVKQDASSPYIVALLSALLYALNQGSERLQKDPESSPYYHDIVLPLLSRTATSDASHPKAFDNEPTLDLVGRICNLIIRSQTLEHQNNVASELYTLFSEKPQTDAPPLNATLAPEAGKTMIVSTHLLASLRKEATLPVELQLLISSLVEYSQQPELSVPVRSASLSQLSLLFNKFVPTPAVRSQIDFLLNTPIELFALEKLDPPRIRVVFAVLKGIVLRNSPLLSSLYPKLLSFLSHPQYGTVVAHGFATLLQPDDLLIKANHCQISGLHRQKTFALLVPSIAESHRSASLDARPNYLIALSGVLKWLPFDIIVEEVGQLIPLLLQSLDLKGEDLVKEAAISTFISILQERPKLAEEHAGSLVNRLIDNSTPSSSKHPIQVGAATGSISTPPRVRSTAIKCLALVPEKLKREVVLKYRRHVVTKLSVALDDPKREVRSAAVKCRRIWLDFENDDDDD